LDRLGDPGDRFQERENELLDRIFRLLGGAAPEKTPHEPPPETLAEQADQLGDDGERGGGRHSGKVAQSAGLVKKNNNFANARIRAFGSGYCGGGLKPTLHD